MSLFKACVVIFIFILISSLKRNLSKGSSAKKQTYSKPVKTNQPKTKGSFNYDKEKNSNKKIRNNRKEPDCDLDERVFGPRNGKKDIFWYNKRQDNISCRFILVI